MPTIEGKQADLWINDYVRNAGNLAGVTKAVRTLVKSTVKGVEEYVNPWKIPSFDSNGPLCCFMAGKQHVTFAFMRGASLPDPEKLQEGTGKGVRHVKLHSLADCCVEIDDAAGDLVEPGEHSALIFDLQRWRLRDDLVAGLR